MVGGDCGSGRTVRVVVVVVSIEGIMLEEGLVLMVGVWVGLRLNLVDGGS
jgi:hypothetical protein